MIAMPHTVSSTKLIAHGHDDRATTPAHDWLRALEATSEIAKDPRRTFPAIVNELARRFGDAPALISDAETFSFRALAARMNRYSRWALAQGIGPGVTVGLLMPNRPEYLAIWLGVTQVGGVVALLNTNLAGRALAHCIAVATPRHIIVDVELSAAYLEAASMLVQPPALSLHGGDLPFARSIDAFCGELPPLEAAAPTLSSPALLIYTSGTTGLPKAANVSHHRIVAWSAWFAGLSDTGPDDRMYDCLPMYHSVGGVVAIGALLVNGGSVVLRDRFSASDFWRDVVRHDCTMVQYIGELCRYLVAAPTDPYARSHRLRIACGNGLRADVWKAFQTRFAVPRVLEFYAATEGNFSLYNVEGEIGAIGRVPPFLRARSPIALVRFDAERQGPARGADGFCERCAAGEAGEAIGRLPNEERDPSSRFEGYTDAAESEKKILRNVFATGDAYVRTGDLMRMDLKGFYYFVDRVGDTFRWKGENVSTQEVAAVLAACPGVLDAAVYGVVVPHAEGRAGMALLAMPDALELDAITNAVKTLPDYARPVFLRIGCAIGVTETFKHKKSALSGEGFDPDRVTDQLFVYDKTRGSYVALDREIHQAIVEGAVRL